MPPIAVAGSKRTGGERGNDQGRGDDRGKGKGEDRARQGTAMAV